MLDLKQIEIEYKISAIFAGIAFIISLLLGFISGNNIGLILIRSFISLFIFLLLGYSAIFIIKRFVPEVYQLFQASDVIINNDDTQIDINEASGKGIEESAKGDRQEEIDSKSPDTSSDTYSVNTAKDDDFEDEISSVDKSSLSNSEPSSGTIIGKSKLESDFMQKIKYEPKIVAEAVRTMMKKDDE